MYITVPLRFLFGSSAEVGSRKCGNPSLVKKVDSFATNAVNQSISKNLHKGKESRSLAKSVVYVIAFG